MIHHPNVFVIDATVAILVLTSPLWVTSFPCFHSTFVRACRVVCDRVFNHVIKLPLIFLVLKDSDHCLLVLPATLFTDIVEDIADEVIRDSLIFNEPVM
jgi:hypothetical protein